MVHSTLIPVDDLSFDAEVLASPIPVLVDVTAAWCAPCRALLPIVERVARELDGRARVVALDVDQAPGVAARLGIRGAPTLIVFSNGREVARQVGFVPETIVRRLLAAGLDDARGAPAGA